MVTTAALVSHVAAIPLISRRTSGAIPVRPGGIKDIVITAQNTLNATNPVSTPTHANATSFIAHANQNLPMALVNNIGGAVNAYITGLDPSGRIVFVQPNGQFFYPYADASYTTPREIFADIAIPLNTG